MQRKIGKQKQPQLPLKAFEVTVTIPFSNYSVIKRFIVISRTIPKREEFGITVAFEAVELTRYELLICK